MERSGPIQTGHICWSLCPTAQSSWGGLQEVHQERKAEVLRGGAAPGAAGLEEQ